MPILAQQRDRPIAAAGHPTEVQIAVGEAAPDFELPNADGRPVQLSDLVGNPVVLYFYPADDTPGCTMEAQLFRTYFEAISRKQAAIIGVSRDNQENHCAFRDKHALPFELLSDEAGTVHDLYGAWRRPPLRRGVVMARRCTFLIDSAGIVRKVYARVNVAGHAREVVQDLGRMVD